MEHQIRKQLREDLGLAGMAETSQSSYLEAIDMFFKRTWLTPDTVSERDLVDYLKHLKDVGAAQGTFKVARHALFFLFQNTMQHKWPLFEKKYARRARKGSPKRSPTPNASKSFRLCASPSSGPASPPCTPAG